MSHEEYNDFVFPFTECDLGTKNLYDSLRQLHHRFPSLPKNKKNQIQFINIQPKTNKQYDVLVNILNIILQNENERVDSNDVKAIEFCLLYNGYKRYSY